MDRNELFQTVKTLLTQIQEMSGREVPEINTNTVPIKDLPGFDSLIGLEFTVMLPLEIQSKDLNLCVSDDGTRALSVNEIIDRIIAYSNPSTEENSR
jgi:acyl carrier protein